MANELQMTGATGLTIKAIIWNEEGQRWNGSAFAATSSFTVGEWPTDGVVTCSELEDEGDNGLGVYAGDWPAITDAADYVVEFYQTSVGVGNLHSVATYNPAGVAETLAAISTVDSNVDAILVDTNDLQGNQEDWATATSVSISAGGITAASLANDAITAAKIADDAVNEIQSGLSTVTTAEVNAEVLDVLITDTLVDGKTFQEAMRYMAARLAGKLSGAGDGAETVVGLDGSTDRVTFTVDASGNITAVSYDP